jgi:hypothetical protein
MKIMFNSLDRSFGFKKRRRYGRETQEILYFAKHHSLFLSIHIYRVRLWCFAKHKTSHASRPYLKFKSLNGRSKPLNMISILNIFVDQILYIFFNLFAIF